MTSGITWIRQPEKRYGEGWHWIDGSCYYMNARGEMAVDTWIDGYYVDASGKWIKDAKKRSAYT